MVTVTPASVSALNFINSRPSGAPASVRRSSNACVGCSCMPSPAFSTGRRVSASSSQGAPDELWRRMIASAPSALSVRPVSFSVSPFSMLDERLETSVVSAPSPLAASSKLCGSAWRTHRRGAQRGACQRAIPNQGVLIFEKMLRDREYD